MFRDLFFRSRDGLDLYARDYAPTGEDLGVPLVALHGLTRNSRDFEEFAPKAAALGHRVLVPDTRGRGRSTRDPSPERYHPFTYADDVRALLEAAGVSAAGFVGTSMGGIVTFVVATMSPELVLGALVNDVGPELSPVGLGRIAGYVGKGSPVRTWDDARAYAKRTSGVAYPRYTDADWDTFARRIFDEGPDGEPVLAYDPAIASAFATQNRGAAAEGSTWDAFARMAARVPTVLVRGAISDLVDEPIATKMKERAPELTVVSVPDVGHTPTLVEPEAWDAFVAWAKRLAKMS